MQKRSPSIPLDEDRSDEMLSIVEVDLEADDDLGEEQHSYSYMVRVYFNKFRLKIRKLKHRRNSHL